MKHFILFLSLSLTFISFTQEDIQIKATKQGWASGICCNSGINYAIRITSTEFDLSHYDVDTIFVDSTAFYCNLKVTKSKNLIQITFGTSYNRQGYNKINLEELDPYKKSTKASHDNLILLVDRRQKLDLKIDKLEELFPIPYP